MLEGTLMRLIFRLTVVAVLALVPGLAQAGVVLPVVAAENFYGDVAGQIGGTNVEVTSILSNPDQDPHLFEASPSVARAISAAKLVVYNGIGYDPWAQKLVAAAANPDRKLIVVADLVGRKSGDNPHIWYDPATMLAFATACARELSLIDPAHKSDYDRNLAKFRQSLAPIEAKVAALRQRFAGTPVTATEPVFGYMFAALGMTVRNLPFQLAVMNDTEPGASRVAAFEIDLRQNKVRLLAYNNQATDAMAERMVELARQSHVPVIAVAETEPPGKTYQAWLTDTLDAVEQALAE